MLRCEECGAEAEENAEGWRAYLTVDDEVAGYCPDCSEREFGTTKEQRGPESNWEARTTRATLGTRYASATEASAPAADRDSLVSARSAATVSSRSANVIGPAASRNKATHLAAARS